MMMAASSLQRWTTAALGDVARIERSGIAPEQIQSGTTYVGLENIASGGSFVGVGPVSNGELASTKFVFTPKHVLYGKLRPYLAKIACPDFDGVCSTDILPILPGEQLDRRYLCYFLRQPHMVQFATSRCSGANLPRLSPNQLANFEIPLPPLSEQRRIADILDKADAIRRKRQEAVDVLSALAQSALQRVIATSRKAGDAEQPIGDVADVQGGIALSAKRKSLPLQVPYLRVANVYRDHLDLSEVKHVGVSEAELAKTLLQKGDVLIVEGHGNREEIGRSSVWDASIAECVHQNHLIRARPLANRIRPEYLSAYINSQAGRAKLMRHGKTTSGLNTISLTNVRETLIEVPDLDLQDEFTDTLRAVERLKVDYRRSEADENDLFDSLAQRAFRGLLS